jgi:hypothetical protein
MPERSWVRALRCPGESVRPDRLIRLAKKFRTFPSKSTALEKSGRPENEMGIESRSAVRSLTAKVLRKQRDQRGIR